MIKQKHLKVEVDKDSGFCFGVINAITHAEKYLSKNKKLFCLGEIVHNEEEIERLQKQGLEVIDKNKLSVLKKSKVLFRAHGEPPESYAIALKNENEIIDASCPIILKIQKQIIKSFQNKENIFIYGKKNHPEIIGLNGQIGGNAVVFEKYEEIKNKKLPDKITLFSQTTMSLSGFYEIINEIKKGGVDLKVKDTICRQVSGREDKLKNFCRRFDVVIFVSGKHSSNGKVLYEVCKSTNKNTYFVSSEKEIKMKWFKENNKVGICGATSTPMWLMHKIKDKLLEK